jgi:hypothetical protein
MVFGPKLVLCLTGNRSDLDIDDSRSVKNEMDGFILEIADSQQQHEPTCLAQARRPD